jgi:hypothetical protein
MLETTLVLLAVVAIGCVGLFATVFTSTLVTVLGLATLLLGLAVGVPTGFWYHVILYRSVSKKMRLPRQWWLSPSRLHRHLTGAEQRRIDPWYRIGGVGFALSVAGGLVAIIALLMARR